MAQENNQNAGRGMDETKQRGKASHQSEGGDSGSEGGKSGNQGE